MENFAKLEAQIRNLLREATNTLESNVADFAETTDLIHRLLQIADVAHDARFPFSEQHLENAAYALELQLNSSASATTANITRATSNSAAPTTEHADGKMQ
jgi:hypothetical protein